MCTDDRDMERLAMATAGAPNEAQSCGGGARKGDSDGRLAEGYKNLMAILRDPQGPPCGGTSLIHGPQNAGPVRFSIGCKQKLLAKLVA